MQNNRIDIDEKIRYTLDLIKRIKVLDDVITLTNDQFLVNDILLMISELREKAHELRSDLNKYFEYEKVNNLPRDFNYKRLYKSLEGF